MRRKTGSGHDDTGSAAASLEIEFEDEFEDGEEDALPAPQAPRSRSLRPLALAGLAALLLGSALWASRGQNASPGPAPTLTAVSSTVPPDYGAYIVIVGYQRSRLLSLAQRRIEVDLRVTPVTGAKVKIISYSISENGVAVRADPPPSAATLPTAGSDVKLDLTVDDCSAVAIGETMAYVDVVAKGPEGTLDRFTALGARFSGDLAALLREVCPARSSSQGPASVTAAGP